MSRMMLILAALGLVLALSPHGASAASKDEIKAMLQKRFGVEVLRLRDIEVGGHAAIEATVMNHAGNSNAAFQVNRLVVDKATGELMSQFQHLPSGYTLGGGGPTDPMQDTGELSRRLLPQSR